MKRPTNEHNSRDALGESGVFAYKIEHFEWKYCIKDASTSRISNNVAVNTTTIVSSCN